MSAHSPTVLVGSGIELSSGHGGYLQAQSRADVCRAFVMDAAKYLNDLADIEESYAQKLRELEKTRMTVNMPEGRAGGASITWGAAAMSTSARSAFHMQFSRSLRGEYVQLSECVEQTSNEELKKVLPKDVTSQWGVLKSVLAQADCGEDPATAAKTAQEALNAFESANKNIIVQAWKGLQTAELARAHGIIAAATTLSSSVADLGSQTHAEGARQMKMSQLANPEQDWIDYVAQEGTPTTPTSTRRRRLAPTLARPAASEEITPAAPRPLITKSASVGTLSLDGLGSAEGLAEGRTGGGLAAAYGLAEEDVAEGPGGQPLARPYPFRARYKSYPALEVDVLIADCVEWMRAKEWHMEEEGLFRIPASLKQIEGLLARYDSGKGSLEEIGDPMCVCGLIKLWVKKAANLIPGSYMEPFLEADSLEDEEMKSWAFRTLLTALPERLSLCLLLRLLQEIVTYSKKNKMHATNLAKVIGPTLLWKLNIGPATVITQYMIENPALFDELDGRQ